MATTQEAPAGLRPGTVVWIPCEVKPGPFSDERIVRVSSDAGGWVGFVPSWYLRDPHMEHGKTFIKGVVEEVHTGSYTARLPGHYLTSSLFTGAASQVQRVDTLAA